MRVGVGLPNAVPGADGAAPLEWARHELILVGVRTEPEQLDRLAETVL